MFHDVHTNGCTHEWDKNITPLAWGAGTKNTLNPGIMISPHFKLRLIISKNL